MWRGDGQWSLPWLQFFQPLLNLLAGGFHDAQFAAVFGDCVADTRWFLRSCVVDADFGNSDRLGQFYDTALRVRAARLDVLFNDVNAFDRHLVFAWVCGQDFAGLALVFAEANHDGVAFFESDFKYFVHYNTSGARLIILL